MSRTSINKIRIVNLNYNSDHNRINDITIALKGKDTLLSMANATGKTTMIHAILAALMHRGKVTYKSGNTRGSMRSFLSQKMSRPTVVMLEWNVNDLTIIHGYVAKMIRSQNEDQGRDIDMSYFILVVDNNAQLFSFSVENVAVTEKDEAGSIVKTSADIKKLFSKYAKDPDLEFFDVYNAANNANAYFDKLKALGIPSWEVWEEIVKKVNSSESNLSDFFQDSHTSLSLMQNFILPKVEKKLKSRLDAGGEKTIEALKTETNDYIEQYKDHQKEIQTQEIVTHCKELLEDLVPMARNYVDRFNSAKQYSGHMHYISQTIHHKTDALEASSKEAQNRSEEIQNKITYKKYSKYSATYYHYDHEYQDLIEKGNKLSEKIASIEQSIDENKREISLLGVAESYERYTKASRELETAKTETENILKDVASLKEQANYLGSLLKDYYGQKKEELETKFNSYKETIDQCDQEIKDHKKRFTVIEKNLMDTISQKATAKASTEQFVELVDSFNDHSPFTLTQNLFDMYDDQQFEDIKAQLQKISVDLKQKQEELESSLKDLEERKTQDQTSINQSELHIKDLQYQSNDCKNTLAKDEKILAMRLDLLKYVDMDESYLFQKEAIIEAFQAKLNGFKEDLRIETEKKNDLVNQLNALKTGQSFRVSQSFEKALKRMQINAIYGTQFLKENTLFTEEQKMEFVKKHPMLPYSIVVQKEDLERIQRRVDVFVDEPVSFFAREDITSDGGASQWIIGDGDSGLIYFHQNEKLFSTEWVKSQEQMINEKITTVDAKLTELNENISLYTDKLNGLMYCDDVSEEDYHNLQRQIEKLDADMKTEQASLADLKNDLETIAKAISEAKAKIEQNRKDCEDHKDLTKEFKNLYEKKDDYAKKLKLVQKLEDQIDALTKQRDQTNALISQNEASRVETQKSLNNMQPELLEAKSNYSHYEHYKASKCPEGFDVPDDYEKMKGQLDGLESVINQQTSGAEEELQRATKRFNDEEKNFNEAKKRFTRKYETEGEEWTSIRYDHDRLSSLEDENEDLGEQLRSYNQDYVEISNAATKAKTNQEHAMTRIHELGYRDPLEEHQIIKEDYDKAIHHYQEELKECKIQIQILDQESLAFRKVYVNVDRYLSDDLFDRHQIKDPVALEEDLSQYSASEIDQISRRVERQYEENVQQALSEKKRLLRACDDNMDVELKVGTGFFSTIQLEINDVFNNKENEKHHKWADAIVDTIDEAINRVEERLENSRRQLASVISAKHTLTDNLLRYCDEVHKEIKKIDRNSLMTLRDDEPERKMFEIVLPSSHSNMELKDRPERPLISEYLDEMIEVCLHDDQMTKEKQKPYIDQKISTKNLFAHVYCRDRFGIKVIKIDNDQMRGQTLAWEDAPASGAQGALISFTIIVCMMNYLSLDESEKLVKNRSKGSVIFIDNPYGELSTEPYLTIFSKMAKNNNIQIISFSALTDQSITNKFDVLYTLKLFETRNGKNLLKLYEGLDQLPPLDETTNILENEYLKVE